MDKNTSKPSAIEAYIDVSSLTEEQAREALTELQNFLARFTDYKADLHYTVKEADLSAGDVLCAHDELGIRGPASGSRWLCRRVKGHDDPNKNGGHYYRWVYDHELQEQS